MTISVYINTGGGLQLEVLHTTGAGAAELERGCVRAEEPARVPCRALEVVVPRWAATSKCW